MYRDNAGFVLPQSRGWTTRVVLFDAFWSDIWDDVSDEVAGGYGGYTDTALGLRDLIEHDTKRKYYRPRSQRSMRAAVQVDQEDPRCAEVSARLQESFKQNVFNTHPLRTSLGTSGHM